LQPGGPALLRNWSIKPQAHGHHRSGQHSDPSSRSERTTSGTTSPIDSGYESAGTEFHLRQSLKISSLPTTAFHHDKGSQSRSQFGSGEDTDKAEPQLKDASKAFFGQINNHSQAAKEKMRCFRVAKLES
jgi:hypothetical protein